MIWITINTFFAVILLSSGIATLSSVWGETVGEKGLKALLSMGMIFAGCWLINLSIYSIVELVIRAVNQ